MRTTREEKHGGETTKANGYVHSSSLRSELIASYPQLLLPKKRTEEKERVAQTDRPLRVTHKQPPSDMCLGHPPGGCVWITPRKGDRIQDAFLRPDNREQPT